MSIDNNPYQTPQSSVEKTNPNEAPVKYVGFWARVAASIIDNILLLIVTVPLLYAVYGQSYFSSQGSDSGIFDIIVSYIFPIVAIVLFWTYKQATPGKMLFNAKIVDAKTGDKPTMGQWLIRYIGYIPSTLVLFLGLMWVGWDKRKQGWHDKMAGTVVVYKR